ncbi:unnamed protein product, partial [Ascophyllum nodosum]
CPVGQNAEGGRLFANITTKTAGRIVSSHGLLKKQVEYQKQTGGHFATCEIPVSCLYRAPTYPVRGLYRAFHYTVSALLAGSAGC